MRGILDKDPRSSYHVIMFDISSPGTIKLERDLERFKEQAIPFAVRNTLNRAAFGTQGRGKAKVRSDMVLRNSFTEKSIQVERARGLNVAIMEAAVGSTLDYMEDQEFGTTKVSGGKRGVPLPTTTASGEGMGAQPRRKLPRAANRLGRIQLGSQTGKGFKSKRQEIFLRVRETVRAGHKFLYLDTGRKQAIYQVKGRGRVDKQGRITGIRMRMVYDLTRRSVNIPKSPWLKPSFDGMLREIPKIYERSLVFQLKRHNLFTG